MTDLRITVRNTSDDGGTFTTPFYFGFHDGNFDLFDVGSAASAGLEALAEDGVFGPLAAERSAASPGSQGLVVAGAAGPIATQEITSNTIEVDTSINTSVSFGAMILPSNDAFVGTDDALVLFDADGNFLGAQTVEFAGSDVYDAGTEVNTELDAAFLNQMGPNTGITENGVVTLHPGFNGSRGNPVGEGDQLILGGTNAFGFEIDERAADFTRGRAEIATVHINTVVETNGTDGRDAIIGGDDDDIVAAGSGQDEIRGRDGWDVLNGEGGSDKILGGKGDDIIDGGSGGDFVSGGADNDVVFGGRGDDTLNGGSGDDLVDGGTQDDWVSGNGGDDTITGGKGDDVSFGGQGDDTFVFNAGDDDDTIWDFNRQGDDQVALSVDGITRFADVLEVASDSWRGVELDFGDDGSLLLRNVDLADLSASDFVFV